MNPLAGWENFYVILGSSAGALIGLQFVVMALLADLPRTASQAEAGNAFATPNVVHFGAVLLLSALLSAPWRGMGIVTVLLGILGFGGVAYALIIARRMRVQTIYRPVSEDWLFHAILPFVGYAMLATSAYEARTDTYSPMFGVGGAALLLLVVGIHNAWDAATYHIFVVRSKRHHPEQDSLQPTSSTESRGSQ
ncbi:MAG TPA: hypothetical protein VMS18_20625 [Candidatus Binatia bacterium]|nr:hypothetical protein [Candidatus Binatia bacterium]